MIRPKVYIAGPYTKGDVAVNVRKAINAGNTLIDLGFAPYVPHLTHFIHMIHPRAYETWINLDETWVLSCDCLLRLPGESKGAESEVRLALENNIPVYISIEELVADWIRKRKKERESSE